MPPSDSRKAFDVMADIRRAAAANSQNWQGNGTHTGIATEDREQNWISSNESLWHFLCIILAGYAKGFESMHDFLPIALSVGVLALFLTIVVKAVRRVKASEVARSRKDHFESDVWSLDHPNANDLNADSQDRWVLS